MTDPVQILVVEDDPQIQGVLRSLLAQQGYEVETAGSAEDGLSLAAREHFDLVLCDISLPGRSGIDAIGELRDALPDAPVLLVTAYPSIETAVEGMRAGAFDYVTKPFNRQELMQRIERGLQHRALEVENRTLRQQTRGSQHFAGLLGESPAMRDILSRIRRVASSRSNVLITGESGTGKDVVAQAIHLAGASAAAPFLAINCSAIPSELLESELFGHVRGAFTGATVDKRGLFEEAGRGTLFLDEIGDLDLNLQSKLLRVLQHREVRPVGGTRSVAIHARIVAATNSDLRKAIDDGRFRRDLFFRLNVIPIHVPPLRERPEDVPLLAEHFLERHAGREKRSLSPGARSLLMRQRWEGNARELENVIERALVLTDAPLIQPEDLPLEEGSAAVTSDDFAQLLEVAAREQVTVRQLADRYIEHVIELSGGNKSQAARRLGVAVRTLYRRTAPGESAAPRR